MELTEKLARAMEIRAGKPWDEEYSGSQKRWLTLQAEIILQALHSLNPNELVELCNEVECGVALRPDEYFRWKPEGGGGDER